MLIPPDLRRSRPERWILPATSTLGISVPPRGIDPPRFGWRIRDEAAKAGDARLGSPGQEAHVVGHGHEIKAPSDCLRGVVRRASVEGRADARLARRRCDGADRLDHLGLLPIETGAMAAPGEAEREVGRADIDAVETGCRADRVE